MENITLSKKNLPLVLLLQFFCAIGLAQSPQTYNADGTFVVPAGVTSITVEAWGGGGHGGTRSSTNGACGGGGGGGYARKVIAVTPGQSFTVTVGTGATTNTAGEDSWFGTSATVLARGGSSAANNSTTAGSGAAVGIGDFTYGGGNGSNANYSTNSGAGGASAGTAAAGGNASGITGGTAPAGGVNGANGRNSSNNGIAGTAPGGGGGGAYRSTTGTFTGGNGGDGRVVVSFGEINLQGNATSIVNADPSPTTTDWTDFGSTDVGTPITRTFTIQNTGAGYLTVGAISFSGTNASEFSVTTAPSSSVSPSGSTTFIVTFNPTGTGTRSATISIINSDADENPYTFAIQGTGIPVPEIDMQGNGVSIADGDATPVTTDNTDFGSIDYTSGTIPVTYTIYNTGTLTLNLGAITIGGTNATDFAVTTAPAATVAPGGNTTVVITFNPSAVGVRNATLSMVTNDTNENPYNFSIRGTGTDPEINVQGNSTTIGDGDITPSATDWTIFGSTDYVSGTISRTFTIQNTTGTGALNISGTSITGPNAADFTVTTASPATIAAGASATFVVTFDPSVVGTRNATVNIFSNDVTEATYDFAVQGTGTTEPEMDVQGNAVSIADGDVTPTTTDWTHFGNVESTVGTAVRTFTIYNSGSMALTVGAITFTGTNPTDFTVTAAPAASVPAGGSTTFNVTFNPGATGTRTATMSIVNNDLNENPYNFSLQGTGTNPEINLVGNLISITNGDLSPSVSDNTDFGTVSIDAGSTLVTYTIQNTGTGSLNIGAITFSGANASDFSISIAPASSVAAAGSTTFTVSFNPVTTGTKVAQLSIANDDANENPYYFQITGLGVRTYPDTDGDNVSDNFDIDDDNDGIPDTTEQTECILSPLAGSVTNTFLNETFGTGTTRGLININIPGATCSYCYEDGIVGPDYGTCTYQYLASLNDGEYVVINSIADHGWTAPEDHTPSDTNGRMAVFNASYDPGTFYETSITGIIPNVPVTYSFWVLNIMPQVNYPGSILPNITVEFLDSSNTVISTYNTGDIGRCNGGTGVNTCTANEWQQYTTTVNLGAITTFTIRFKNNAPGGGGNDLAIDDITLKQQYCDRDGDTIADLFDLDSDNDGIPDIEEGGYKSLSSGKATIDRTLGSWADANANGLVDSIDSQISGGTYSIPDTDGDGVKDFHDLDSDNDSMFDVDESNLYNGDGDINGDGFGDGADTDKDGILDLFDTSVTFGTAARPYANDTDSDGLADYREIDANTDSVKDILTTLYASFDANLDGVIDGSTDVDKDGILDSFDTKTTALGSPRDLNKKLYLDFDGRNDYGEAPQMLSGLAKSTMMGWIKLSNPYSNTGVVMGQENFSIRVDMTSGSPKLIAVAKGGVFVTYPVALAPDRWYHICAVYDGTSSTERLKLYVNGRLEVLDNSGSLAGTLATSTAKFTLGKNATSSADYFKGSIDEVRVFNTALTTDQIQKMVYQEIKQNGIAVRGEIIPKDIESTVWFNLIAYYRMDAYKDDVIDNRTTAAIDSGTSTTFARIYNHKVIKYQLAPMPFVTTQSSALDLAVSQNNFVNGNDLYNYDWSILQVKHNINLPYNITGLGLFVDPSINLVLSNDNKVQNTWYMLLNGTMDLQGKSQLVQTANSDLDPLSGGKIERDQQGQTNHWNYNYWGCPVGAINATTNNNNFTVASVMRDGTNPANPQALQWTSGLNSIASTPITLSSYWIFKFQNVTNAYANWSSVGPNGTLSTGQGFTLKGSNALTPSQNYVFVGKPNNGSVSIPIAANNLNLCGNPYPSAIDANQFIIDNASSITGTLYFWEHFATNNTHVLADYQGGYATYNLTGGTHAVSPVGVSTNGSSTKVPGRFVPVGQGFFVTGSVTGGTVKFNNGQRAFVRETDTNSNTMFRPGSAHVGEQNILNNNPDVFEADTFARIRVGFNAANYHRQTLIGFMDDHATAGIDPGYDGLHIDGQPNDMYFRNSNVNFNIMGEGYFNSANIYPLGVKVAVAGNVAFTLDGTENFDENQPIYIYDNVTQLYHDIREENFEIALPSGTNNDRFSLRFTGGSSPSLGTTEVTLENGIFVAYTNANSTINIKNNVSDATVTSVALFNMLGQSISTWDVEHDDQHNIRIPVQHLATGTYIVKMKTTKGDLSKKVIIR
jgi:hypothetical protein